MADYSISPALRLLYARQEILMGRARLSADERRELCGIPDKLDKEWKIERARRCLERQGPPRTLTTGPSPLDQAYGDR